MSTTLEDRLAAALTARAEQIHPEDLRPADPPTTGHTPLLGRTAPYLLAAAACALIVAVPLVLFDGDGQDRPTGPIDSPAAPITPNGDLVEGADWPRISASDLYDVDGDGTADRLVTRTESGKEITDEPWRLDVQLSSGGTTAIVLDYGSYGINPIEPIELDGDGADEILYYRGTEAEEIGVLEYADGALVDLDVPAEPGITSQLDGQGRINAWWVTDRMLFSSRSFLGGFVAGDDTQRLPSRYQVELWTWAVVDGVLRPQPQGERCVKQLQETRPFPCSDSGPGPLPGTRTEATESKAVGESFEVDVSGDGVLDTVALEGPTGPATVEEGEVELYVTLGGGGGELHAPVPAGWTPAVFTTPYAGPGTPGLLVEQEGGDRTSMTMYLIRGDALVPADVWVGSRLGNGFAGEQGETRYDTWLTTEGRLFYREVPTDQLDEDVWQISEWQLRDTTLAIEEIYGWGCWEC